MKTIRKNFLLLAFAAGALFLIGNNVRAEDPIEIEEPGDGDGGTIAPEVCSSSTLCNPHFTDYVRPYDGMRFCCSNNVHGQRGKAKK